MYFSSSLYERSSTAGSIAELLLLLLTLLSTIFVVSYDTSTDDSEVLYSSIELAIDDSMEEFLDTLASALVELLLEQPTILAIDTIKANIKAITFTLFFI